MIVRRALSLFELMIVIALLGAMLAIVLPATFGQLARNAFDASQDQLQGQALLIRSHAMSTGETLEWRYRVNRRVVEVRRFETDDLAVALRAEASRESQRTRPEAPAELEIGPDAPINPAQIVTPLGSWASMELPRGVRLTDQPPNDLLEEVPFGMELPDVELDPLDGLFDEEGEERTIRLGVFLPDGSVLLARDVWLRNDDDVAAKMTINGWTARLEFARITPATSDEAAPEENEEASDDGNEPSSPAASGGNNSSTSGPTGSGRDAGSSNSGGGAR